MYLFNFTTTPLYDRFARCFLQNYQHFPKNVYIAPKKGMASLAPQSNYRLNKTPKEISKYLGKFITIKWFDEYVLLITRRLNYVSSKNQYLICYLFNSYLIP